MDRVWSQASKNRLIYVLPKVLSTLGVLWDMLKTKTGFLYLGAIFTWRVRHGRTWFHWFKHWIDRKLRLSTLRICTNLVIRFILPMTSTDIDNIQFNSFPGGSVSKLNYLIVWHFLLCVLKFHLTIIYHVWYHEKLVIDYYVHLDSSLWCAILFNSIWMKQIIHKHTKVRTCKAVSKGRS